MSPHAIPAVAVLSFVTPLFAFALWLIHGHRKEVEKGRLGTSLYRGTGISLTIR
jgi:hypothetical protein